MQGGGIYNLVPLENRRFKKKFLKLIPIRILKLRTRLRKRRRQIPYNIDYSSAFGGRQKIRWTGVDSYHRTCRQGVLHNGLVKEKCAEHGRLNFDNVVIAVNGVDCSLLGGTDAFS